MEYIIGIYAKIHTIGYYITIISGILTVVGGVVLLLMLADNQATGELHFSQEYMASRAAEHKTLIIWWRRVVVIFVICVLVGIFAPDNELILQWQQSLNAKLGNV